MKTTFYFLLSYTGLLVFVSCEREWNNPWDSNADITIQLSGVSISTLSIDSVEISWTVQPKPEGLKIDKKINDEPWVNDYATVTDSDYFIDTNLNTSKNSYQYRVYAFAGTNTSNPKIINYDFACGFDSVVDPRNGLKYKTTQIGKQCWFAENLKYLPEVFPPSDLSQNENRYYVYNYDGSSIVEAQNTSQYKSYGVLYNAVSAAAACPEADGWYLPDENDWQGLLNYSGGNNIAGVALKEKGFTHWNEPNTGALNTFGFNARPGGKLDITEYFGGQGDIAYFWAGTETTFGMHHNSTMVTQFWYTQFSSNSIRCIKKQ